MENPEFHTWSIKSKHDGNYQPINTNVIRNLKSKCDPNDVFCFKNQFNPGDNVKLINGPFTNFLARIEQVAPNERVWLLLDVMGKSLQVKASTKDIGYD